MTRERIRFLPDLQEQARRVKEGKAKKHKTAEKLGKTFIPWILTSVENIEFVFAQIGTMEYQETDILEKMCGAQVVKRNLTQPPGVEVLNFLSKQLADDDTLKEGVAANLLEGIFLYPSRLYKEIPRGEPSERAQRSFEEAIRVSTEILYSFAWALILSDRSVQEKALGLFQERILNPPGMTTFDLAGRPYFLSSSDWEQYLSWGIAAVTTLDLLSFRMFGEERCQRNFRQLKEHDQDVEKRLERFPLGPQRKEEAIRLVLVMEEKVKNVERGIELDLSKVADIKRYRSPLDKEPLLNEAIRLQIEMVGESFLRGMDFFIVDFPRGVKMLIFRETLPDDSLKKARERIIRPNVLRSLSQKPHYQERLNVRELETIINHLGPDYPPEFLLPSHQELYERVQTGILALPGAGQRVQLRLPDEEFLRQMGLTSLFFKPLGEGGVLVKLEFGKHSFSFALDRNFRPSGKEKTLFWEKFGHLSKNAKLFLLNLTYAYLDSLLHPQRRDEEIKGIKKGGTRGHLELMDVEQTRKYLGSRTYLRVLPLGHYCRQRDNEEIDGIIRNRFGFSLEEIWQTLIAAEGDLKTLQEIKESQPRLWGLAQGLIERIRTKSQKVKWVEVNGQLKMEVGTSEEEHGLFSLEEDKRVCYEVTVVINPESPHPKEVVCPGAAKRIALLAK